MIDSLDCHPGEGGDLDLVSCRNEETPASAGVTR
jgi:hypothetical protein